MSFQGSPIGDLLRAIHALQANASSDSRREIAAALGLELTLPVETPAISGDALQVDVATVAAPDGARPPKDPLTNAIPASVRYIDEAPGGEEPVWLRTATALTAPRPGSFRSIPPKASLLEPLWTRALLVSALATIWESGEIDMADLVEQLSQGSPVDELPLVRVITLARGVHCWLDDGPAMEPFVQDQRQLVAALGNVAGASRVAVRRFQGSPGFDGTFVRGAPHLVLSDLGHVRIPEELVADPVYASDWIEFADWVERYFDARVIALTPLPPAAYPDALRRAITILCWDRTTSVQTARRAMAGVL